MEIGSVGGAGCICKCSRVVYLGLYTRVSTNLMMACSKGKETDIDTDRDSDSDSHTNTDTDGHTFDFFLGGKAAGRAAGRTRAFICVS